MKIAFVSAGTVIYDDFIEQKCLGGTEYQLLGLCRELAQRGHEVYLVRRWYRGPTEEQLGEFKIINIRSPNLPDSIIEKILTKIVYSKYAARLISRMRPDIVNLTGKSSSYYLCTVDIPKVHAAMFNLDGIRPGRFSPRRTLMGAFERRILTHCEAIVVRNIEAQEYLAKCGFKAVVIPVAVELERYTPKSSDDGYIFFGGRLAAEKGLPFLIKAYSKLGDEKQSRFRLVIAGSGPQKQQLEQLCRKYGVDKTVDFIPWLSHAQFIEKLSNCTVFVLPSLYESMGIVMLEAMALGKPVAVSDIPGPQDVITPGKDGYLFEKGNISQLQEFLELLIDNSKLREELGKNARETIEEKYTFEKIADMYLKLYEEITD